MMRAYFTAALLATVAVPALADPWVEVGDRRLREDIELLADAGLVDGPTSVWPLPWAQISAGLDTADAAALNPAQAAALERVKTLMAQREGDGVSFEIKAAATNSPALIRDFSDRARGDVDVVGRTLIQSGNFFASLGVGYRDDPTGRNAQLDSSYVAYAAGNWALYGGYLDHWWGPSHEQSLLLSNNARPFPQVGVSRLVAAPFDSKWLRWIGAWRFDGFVGVLDGPRREPFKNPALVGLRATFEPLPGLEVGLSRLLQLCGTGRPCGPKTWFKSLVPIGSADNTGTLNEPGNQGAGYELRYHWKMGDVQAVTFLHTFAEDTLFEVLSVQAGASLTGPSQLGTWRVAAEAVDTYGRVFSKNQFDKRQPGATYVNFIYTDGFGYRGRPITASLDGDSKLYSLTASLTDTRNRRWAATVRRADINVTDSAIYRVSANRERLWLGEASVDWPTAIGDVTLELRGQTDSPNTPGRRDGEVAAELRWRTSF